MVLGEKHGTNYLPCTHKQPMNAEKRRDLRVTPFSATK